MSSNLIEGTKQSVITKELIAHIRNRFQLPWHGVHGVSHWARVRNNGLRLAQQTGANTRVVELFAFLHDTCRGHEEADDINHGYRAAHFAHQLWKKGVLPITEEELYQLMYACQNHSYDVTEANITVQTCWDADRLDLGRVGITPCPTKLCTNAAKDSRMIMWSLIRSVRL